MQKLMQRMSHCHSRFPPGQILLIFRYYILWIFLVHSQVLLDRPLGYERVYTLSYPRGRDKQHVHHQFIFLQLYYIIPVFKHDFRQTAIFKDLFLITNYIALGSKPN